MLKGTIDSYDARLKGDLTELESVVTTQGEVTNTLRSEFGHALKQVASFADTQGRKAVPDVELSTAIQRLEAMVAELRTEVHLAAN